MTGIALNMSGGAVSELARYALRDLSLCLCASSQALLESQNSLMGRDSPTTLIPNWLFSSDEGSGELLK
jgi:hypothetical protein